MMGFQLHNYIYIPIFSPPVAGKVKLLLDDRILVLKGGRDDDLSLSGDDSAAATLPKRGNQKKGWLEVLETRPLGHVSMYA